MNDVCLLFDRIGIMAGFLTFADFYLKLIFLGKKSLRSTF